MRDLIKHIMEASPFKPASKKEYEERKSKVKMKRFYFPTIISGVGETIHEAWENAVQYFSEDPGTPPEDEVMMVRVDPDTYEEIGKEEPYKP